LKAKREESRRFPPSSLKPELSQEADGKPRKEIIMSEEKAIREKCEAAVIAALEVILANDPLVAFVASRRASAPPKRMAFRC